MSIFKTNTTKNYIKPICVNNKYGGGKKPRKLKIKKKQSEGNIIKNVGNIFKLKKEDEAIKDRIIRDINF